MSLLIQDNIKKRQVNVFLKLELDTKKIKKYAIKTIKDSTIHNNIAKDQLPELYNLVFWNSYSEDESTYELISTIIHL